MTAPLQSVPLFQTSHAPVGAWASLVFGTPGRGVCIRNDTAGTALEADLLIALRRGNQVSAFPFVRSPGDFPDWQFLSPAAIARGLSACTDEYAAPGITFRLLAPHAALPNPKRAGNLQFATAPGILMELQIDNTGSDDPATAFLGLALPPAASAPPLRPVDWTSKTLCGIAHGGQWILAAPAIKNETATLQTRALASALATPEMPLDPSATAGGIVIKIPPRSSRTIPLVFAWYAHGPVTQGIDARCMYTNYFPRMEAVANFLLQNAARVRESCDGFDSRAFAACADPHKFRILAQALRSYDASTQVVESPNPPASATPHGPAAAGPAAFFASIDPVDHRRNPLDTIADRLPWDLFRNPWVVRNLFDLATTHYAYYDRLRFPDTAAGVGGDLIPTGISFARDLGCGSAYAPGSIPAQQADPAARSAFDAAGASPGWSGGRYSTEVLLNSIYMLTGYALLAQDTPWAKTRLPFARELLAGLENRDHPDPNQRTGILKADSALADGPEQTSFAGESPLLANAHGSLSVALKTFCANLLLTTYFQNNNDLHSADYSYAFARKTAAAIAAAFNPETQSLPANLLSPGNSPALVLAALEPLALPTWLGLTSTLAEYFPELYSVLSAHVQTCIKPAPQGCFDAAAPALRLINTAAPNAPERIIPVLFVLERLFQINPETQFPGLWKSLADSLERPAAHLPINLQSLAAALYLKPAAV